jgi:aryl-alcohol dehydrogenase-like predicted oxidoreductase
MRSRNLAVQPSSGTIAGHATPVGTKQFADRFSSTYSADFYRPLAERILVSSIGMGTYLGECNDAEDTRYVTVLSEGIEHGLNLIDTAINYRCQRSERAVGRAIRHVIDAGVARRDEIVVSTKVGYIPLESSPPTSRDLYNKYLADEYFDPGIIAPVDVVNDGHSMTPAFIANQLHRSLINLGLESIDIYYLHNAEQQRSASTSRFRETLLKAFIEMESQVAGGRIRCYGCATWSGFRQGLSAPGWLNLEEIVAVAREVAGESHHFKVIQLPINLAMTEALRVPTQTVGGHPATLMEAAAELGISVVASASLMQSQLTRGLPDQLAVAFPSLATDAQRAIAFVRSLPVTSALVGMRTIDHLNQNLAVAREITVV